MKTIGLIGGMSWESSSEYYRLLNEEVKRLLGGLHSAKCILYSVDFQEIEHFQARGNGTRLVRCLLKLPILWRMQAQVLLLYAPILCIR